MAYTAIMAIAGAQSWREEKLLETIRPGSVPKEFNHGSHILPKHLVNTLTLTLQTPVLIDCIHQRMSRISKKQSLA